MTKDKLISFFKSFKISDLFFVVLAVIWGIFLLNLSPFSTMKSGASTPLNLPTILILFFLFLICGFFYCFFAKKEKILELSNPIIIAFITILFTSVLAILISPNHYEITGVIRTSGQTSLVTVDINNVQKTFFVFSTVISFIMTYLFIFVFSHRLNSFDLLYWILIMVIAISFIAVIYSLIKEWNVYLTFYQLFTSEDVGRYTVKSFFMGRNDFGSLLFFAIFSSLLCHCIKPKQHYFYAFAIFFYIFLIFTWCKTFILLTPFFILMYLIYRLVKTFKEYRKRNTIIIASLGGVFIIGLILLIIAISSKGNKLSFIYKMVKSLTNSRTLTTRKYIWQNVFQLMNSGSSIIFGRGYGIINTLLYPLNILNNDPVIYAHNGFLTILSNGGIILSIAAIMFFVTMIYYVIKFLKQGHSLAWFTLFIAIIFFIYSLITTCNELWLLVFAPIMMLRNQYHQEKEPINTLETIY